MNTSDIRLKLYEYIRVADAKKVKAIFTLVEHEINEMNHWWEDPEVLDELDKQSEAFESRKEKGSPWKEVKKRILVNNAKPRNK
ncbi:hypothetical protein F0L74_01450 [Chitinophaga agrisoli]|uniref:Uncharacterized protein n=1 Tax=Chitinophaga agrisoli TaxID=2607653 RepID=A0A5B2W2F4_9BACT|nr:hypothetical protein [Chitinophaga agrisoli]KAA2244667.1 hypothetical protein F0L74_01450 [Chitinophaga agrisoli]